jgi:regulator of RNase E activity RraB
MSVSSNEGWEVHAYETEGGPVFVIFQSDLEDVDQDAFGFCARVLIPIVDPQDSGGPTQEEAERLNALEDQLIAGLDAAGTDCLHVGRVTHAGVREVVFMVADWETFRPPVGTWMQSVDREIDVSEHDGWQFFFEAMWPSPYGWAHIRNRTVVMQLVEHGSDPEKPHGLEFHFLGEKAALEALQAKLAERGFRDPSFQEGALTSTIDLPLDVDRITDVYMQAHEDAEGLQVELDGWGAMIVS